LIVGAGIGGLAAALGLHEVGFDVRVFESVAELRMLGVGINLLPHAVREVEELGLRSALEASAAQCRELAYFTKRGQRIWSEPRGLDAGYAWPQFSVHRGVLHRVLLDAARERLGPDRIHLGHHLHRFGPRGDGVEAFFSERQPSNAGRMSAARRKNERRDQTATSRSST
jgi:5-methylphenazine-1-carboxylate 1-monooxygenase